MATQTSHFFYLLSAAFLFSSTTPTYPTHNFLPLPSFPSQGLQTEVNIGLDTVEGRHI